MKKPTRQKSKVQRRLAFNRFRQRLEERKRKQARRATTESAKRPPLKRATVPLGQPAWQDYPVPKVLDLMTYRDETCSFFADVRARVIAGQRLRLVFLETEKISSESLIYLLAQMHKLRLEHGNDRITGTYPKSPKIERLLAESGFLHALGVRARKMVGRPLSATRFVKCKTDVEMRSSCIPELRDELLGDDLEMPKPIGKMVFRALSEAMANVQHHAYEQKHLEHHQLKGRWWLGAQLSKKKNFFQLTFYDAGVGIPKTLHRKYTWEHIRGVLSLLPGIEPDDAQMIKAAVELGRSRTGQDNRGKGLLDIHRLITNVGAGALTIFSRGGQYRYEPSGEAISNDGNYVEGTLIKWELPLDKVVAFADMDETDDEDDS